MEEYFRSHTCNGLCRALGLETHSSVKNKLRKLRQLVLAAFSRAGHGPFIPKAMHVDELVAALRLRNVHPSESKCQLDLVSELHSARGTLPLSDDEVDFAFEAAIDGYKITLAEEATAEKAREEAEAEAKAAAAKEVLTNFTGDKVKKITVERQWWQKQQGQCC